LTRKIKFSIKDIKKEHKGHQKPKGHLINFQKKLVFYEGNITVPHIKKKKISLLLKE
jgi:hypothetical protein